MHEGLAAAAMPLHPSDPSQAGRLARQAVWPSPASSMTLYTVQRHLHVLLCRMHHPGRRNADRRQPLPVRMQPLALRLHAVAAPAAVAAHAAAVAMLSTAAPGHAHAGDVELAQRLRHLVVRLLLHRQAAHERRQVRALMHLHPRETSHVA